MTHHKITHPAPQHPSQSSPDPVSNHHQSINSHPQYYLPKSKNSAHLGIMIRGWRQPLAARATSVGLMIAARPGLILLWWSPC
jgi:hypothetical protein